MNRRSLGALALGALLFAATAPGVAQQTRDSAKPVPVPAPAGTGALGGTVTNDDGSRPVRFAYVVLLGTGKGTVKVSSTDADGRFIFTGLPADGYTVGASKPPYLGTIAGARRAARPGTPIVLADGQKVANVAIRMPMGAAITGVIVDEKGVAGPNISVLLQQWRMQGGERTLVVAGGGSTDDRGRYRFYGLAPGEYVVGGLKPGGPMTVRTLSTAEVDAAMRGGAVAPTPPPPPSTVRYAAVYFPGTVRSSDAVSITLAAGEERSNVDFKLDLVQTTKIEGSVATSDGQPLAPGSISMIPVGPTALRILNSVRFMADGRFTFSNVTPGTYALTAVGSGPLAGQLATSIVEVAGADVFGVQLTMGPALSFPARLVFQGAAVAPALSGRRIAFRNVSTAIAGAPPPNVTVTNATGGFMVSNVFPGRYVIGGPLGFGPNTDSMTWALESVIVDGRDMTDLAIEINSDSLPKDVVMYSDRFQGLSGRLTRSTGAPVPEHTIVVFPEDKTYWVVGSRRILTTRPGTDGRFTLSGAGPTTLPPGKYLLAAVTDIDRDEQFDPAFLAALMPASVPVTLQPGEKKVQDLVIK